ncbi:MAG: acyl-CoA dehydrogenase [Chlamydiota bacterium]|nr:acyl-CoA dehydrogenase [Chlamydiota bacterium]
MVFLAWLLWFMMLAWTLWYFRLNLIVWTSAIAVFIFIWIRIHQPYTITAILIVVLYAVFFIPLNIPMLRRKYISGKLFYLYKKMLPSMSQTEREALDAGTVWWDGELFRGRPDWKKLLSYKRPVLTEEEQAFIDGETEALCLLLDDWKINNEINDLSKEAWDFIKEKGFFGIIIPKKYGGLGFSALAHSSIVMKIASRSVAAAVTVMVPNSLGPAELLLHYGTDEQKDYYLPRLAKAEEVPCFALTGPEAGSDATSIPDTGIICKDMYEGRETLGLRLNWDKRYITLAPIATVIGLAFKLYDPDHLLGNKEELGITVALVPANLPGIEIGQRHSALDIPFLTGPTRGKDVFIPVDKILGGPKRVGQGWRMLMENLSVGRSISLPAISTAAGKMTSFIIGAYAHIRKQFKMPIGRFEGIEEPLARIGGNTYLMDAVRVMTLGAVDAGERPSVVSAIVKYNLTERMRVLVNDGMDVQGGAAICLGPRNLLGRVYQSLPISITVEGANILTRTLIIFGQGAIRCHPYLLKQMQAVSNPDTHAGLVQFDKALFGHFGFVFSNIAGSLFLGLTDGRLSKSPSIDPNVKPYYQRLNRMCCAFAVITDAALLVLGGSLKIKEKLSGRLADVLSHLYMACAVLKNFQDKGFLKEDVPLLKWACEETLFIVQERMDAFLFNFPNKPVAWIVRKIIFPLGKPYHGVPDYIGHKVAILVQQPGEARERLCSGIYTPADPQERIGLIRDALDKVVASELVEKKLREAIKKGLIQTGSIDSQLESALHLNIIDENEAQTVMASEKARKEVIAVDDFPM